MSDLGNKMIMYRAKNRLTQKELADRCGLSAQTIHSIENGYQKPSKVTLAKIFMVIGEKENEVQYFADKNI